MRNREERTIMIKGKGEPSFHGPGVKVLGNRKRRKKMEMFPMVSIGVLNGNEV